MPKDMFRYFRYRPLEPIDKSELANYDDDDETGDSTARIAPAPIWTRTQAKLALFGNLVLLAISISTLFVALSRRPAPSELECAKKTSSYCEPNTPYLSPHHHQRLTVCLCSANLGSSILFDERL
jgi:hypothetical protein